MSSDDDEKVAVNVEGIPSNDANLAKVEDSTQLDDKRIQARSGLGLKPPYNPDQLASFLELNETHAVAVRKKARYEVGFGFDIVPVDDIEPDDADDEEFKEAEDFWRSRETKWQTGPHLSAEPTTPEEVLELARQDYHAIGWAALEILTNNMGEPVGLAHVPANTVRVRKPAGYDEDDVEVTEEDLMEARGYVQVRQGRRRFFGEAGDRYRGGEDTDDETIFVDAENGDVANDARALDNEPANELIFVRNPSPLSLHYGIPTWISSIRTITSDEAAKDYNRSFFDNDTIPRMAIKVTGGELSEESKRDLKEMLQNLRDESHRTVLLEVEKFKNSVGDDVDIELEPMSQGISEEMSFESFRQKNEHDIAKAHEVPPILIGVTETSNLSNSEAQVREFATEVVLPEQNKFAERLYQIIHQKALGITDWTVEFELRGADQPGHRADVARKKIQAVEGAIPVNRALEMIGEDPLPEDHDVDGDTLLTNVGESGGDGFFSDGAKDGRPDHAPPVENKVGERDWSEVKEQLTKDPIEQMKFNSSNLDEGAFDFGENELYLSFKRDGGQSSLYAYVDVPTSEWQGLADASSHGSYHYDNIRMDYSYWEVTNFHDRLPEGPVPDETPTGIPDL